MDIVIYLAVAALVVWSVWYVARHILRQIRGKGCDGNCASCGCGCKKRK